MKKIFEAIIEFIRVNGFAVYCPEKIDVDGRPFFMISEDESDGGMTLKWYVENYLLEGNKEVLKEDVDFFIFSDYKSIGILETNLWDEYQNSTNKN